MMEKISRTPNDILCQTSGILFNNPIIPNCDPSVRSLLPRNKINVFFVFVACSFTSMTSFLELS